MITARKSTTHPLVSAPPRRRTTPPPYSHSMILIYRNTLRFKSKFLKCILKRRAPDRQKVALLISKGDFGDSRSARFQRLSASIGRFLASSERQAGCASVGGIPSAGRAPSPDVRRPCASPSAVSGQRERKTAVEPADFAVPVAVLTSKPPGFLRAERIIDDAVGSKQAPRTDHRKRRRVIGSKRAQRKQSAPHEFPRTCLRMSSMS
jgi:hypothetical protein